MIAWAYFTMPTEEELRQRQAERVRQDSIAAAQADTRGRQLQRSVPDQAEELMPEIRQDEEEHQPMGMFSAASVADTSFVTIETPLYQATFTNVGAGPAQIVLKEFKTWDQRPVQMIEDTTQSAYSIGFLTNENYNVETDGLVFEQLTPEKTITLEEGDTRQLQYALTISEQQQIIYTYTLRGDSYQMDLDVEFIGLDRNIIGGTIDFGWEPRLNLTEKDRSQEGVLTSAFVYTGGELDQLNLDGSGRNEQNYNGQVDWVATRTRFFTQIIKSENPTEGARLVGEVTGLSDGSAQTDHHYKSYLQLGVPDNNVANFRLYVGPLSYETLKVFDHHAYDMVDTGYALLRWFSDPLVRYVIIPFFSFAGDYMNYGVAIIIFAILIKLLLFPLTKKSYKSMAAMKELQPKMQEIQEKYKDNPQKQQEATLKLYKKSGVNPLGGCLPNLLQLPILITLWRYFQDSILLRQQEFLWANDLSAPDYILSLPFSIPFLGDQIAGFVLLMTGAMFVQSNLTGGMGTPGGSGPAAGQMAALKYIFPFMLLFIFNNFAAGLSLYYLVYNVVSILQQLMINRQLDQEKEMAAAAS